MEPERVRLILVVGMLLCAGLMLVYPLSSEMSADILFDDDVDDKGPGPQAEQRENGREAVDADVDPPHLGAGVGDAQEHNFVLK